MRPLRHALIAVLALGVLAPATSRGGDSLRSSHSVTA